MCKLILFWTWGHTRHSHASASYFCFWFVATPGSPTHLQPVFNEVKGQRPPSGKGSAAACMQAIWPAQSSLVFFFSFQQLACMLSVDKGHATAVCVRVRVFVLQHILYVVTNLVHIPLLP
eukprot:1141245-Pelagomonas_calceolata.AAC.13